jgi:hypothetical protein
MNNEYTVLGTQSYTYLDPMGRVVDGFKVFLKLYNYGETHYILVPDLNPTSISKAANELVENRKKIALL